MEGLLSTGPTPIASKMNGHIDARPRKIFLNLSKKLTCNAKLLKQVPFKHLVKFGEQIKILFVFNAILRIILGKIKTTKTLTAHKNSLLECLPTPSIYTSVDDKKLVNIKD